MSSCGRHQDECRELECPVCHEMYQTPKILPCGHSLCMSPCLEQLAKNWSVKCPECRASHGYPSSGISGFPTNFVVCRLVENAQSKVSTGCPICSADSALLRCSHCGCSICGNCRAKHTQVMKKALIEQLTEYSKELDSVEALDSEKCALEKLDQVKRNLQEELNEVMHCFYKTIDSRKLELSKYIEDFAGNEQRRIQSSGKRIRDNILAFCEEKTQLLNDTQAQSAILQVEEEIWSLKQEQVTVNDHFTAAVLDIDTEGILQVLKSFGKVDHKDMADHTDVNNPEKVIELAIQRVPLNLSRSFMPVKMSVGRYGSDPGMFKVPCALDVSPVTGNIAVADTGNKRIQIFNPHGKFVCEIVKLQDTNEFIKHLEMSKEGKILTLDSKNSVRCFDEIGTIMFNFMCKAVTTFTYDNCGGNLHLSKTGGGVEVRTFENKIVTTYGLGRDSVRADRICISDSGMIFLVSFTAREKCTQQTYPNHDTMAVFNKEFQLMEKKSVGPIGIDCCTKNHKGNCNFRNISRVPRGSIKLIQDKFFLTTDPEQHTVGIYDLEWNIKKQFGCLGNTIGSLYQPISAAVTLAGDVAVVDGNAMLQFF